MKAWMLAAALGAAAAGIQYARLRAPRAPLRAALALLRAAALAIVLALILDAPLGRARVPRPSVFIDGSLSMRRAHADLWRAAWDSAAGAAGGFDSVWVFGDSIRRGSRNDAPGAAATRVRPVVERTMVTGVPVLLITDGEVQDSSALDGLVSGSRLIVLSRGSHRDAAVVTLDAPRAVVAGDSLAVRVTLAAGPDGAGPGTLVLQVDEQTLGRWPLEAMSAWGERQSDLRARLAGGAGNRVLRAIVASQGDAEPRNDTLAAAIEIARAASAVFVSTSPDQDARFAVAVLRGTLALPTQGFLRVAPGTWRHEGTLAPATEADVRQALRDAPIAIIHGDTALFGPPRAATIGPLALLAPPESENGEWYPSAVPPSPLSGALAAIPLDSLPPIAAGPPAEGEWIALEARRGREAVRRSVVVGHDVPRRVVTVTASGFWRWRFRGGASADAYTALWGSIFDWLAAERADRRGAVPDESWTRAGLPVRWRRGSSADSLVRVVLEARRATRAETLSLRFPPGTAVLETPPLPSGTYDVTVPGGRATLVVNAAAELLPTRPRLASGRVGGRASPDAGHRARSAGWLYGLVVLLLCTEWFVRRRAGLR